MHTRIWPGSLEREHAAVLEELGAAVAHQLKNPLSAVKALVQLGLRNPAEGPSHGRLAAVEAEVARMLEILQGHLAAGRAATVPVPAGAGAGPDAAPAGDLLNP